MDLKHRVFAHELDAAWIIALWKAIHGGDPAPETVAVEAIAALSQYLKDSQADFTFQQMEKQLAILGIQVTHQVAQVEAREVEQGPKRPHQYCFKFKNQTICIQLPRLENLPAVAA